MRIFMVAALLIIYLTADCQEPKKAVIRIDTSICGDALEIPFSAIEVLDARFDRSKIGCIYNKLTPFGISTNKYDAIFPDSLKNYLPEFLSTFIKLDQSKTDRLFILIKSFRLADHFVYNVDGDFDTKLAFSISASFYGERDQKYFKLFSINEILLDKLLWMHEKKRTNRIEGTRSAVLASMIYKLIRSKNFTIDTIQNFFSKTDIDLGINRRYDLPVYTSNPISGAYKTFDEFKNNNPSLRNIKPVFKGDKLESITNENGENIDMANFWGVCDGTKRYVYFRQQFTELIPVDKGFKILSYRTKADMRGKTNFADNATRYGLFSASFLKAGDGIRTPEYFDLNMDTGYFHLEEIFGQSSLGTMHSEILK